jgi:1-acyl-sn-glycerol-3-phosphate acyltransferase
MIRKFYEPRDNEFLIKFAKFILPLTLKHFYKIKEIQIDQKDIEKLKNLKNQRVILCPNHPTTNDPIIMFYLSKVIDYNFNYLAAWDVFVENPIQGYIIQHLGAYSIIRGTLDNDSFKKTIELIVKGKNYLVIFPEGDTNGLNEYIMPFQSGVIQLAFWALDELNKQNNPQNIFILPIAIKYKYLKDMKQEILLALKRIEQKLKIYNIQNESKDPYERLLAIAENLLTIAEKFYNLKRDPNLSFNERLTRIREFIINKVATYLDIKLKDNMSLLNKLRTLFNVINSVIYKENNELNTTDYEKRLYQEKRQELINFYDDLHRVWKFIAIYEGYIKENPSNEKFLEVIKRIEWELFGKEKRYGPLKAIIKIGKEINLLDYYQNYKKQKKETVEHLTNELENQVKELLLKIN